MQTEEGAIGERLMTLGRKPIDRESTPSRRNAIQDWLVEFHTQHRRACAERSKVRIACVSTASSCLSESDLLR